MAQNHKLIALTGASRGLGRMMVRGFVARGHTVWGCARSRQAIDQLAAECGPPHAFRVVDVADESQVAAWAAELLGDGRVPDLLINNAAVINPNANLWQVPIADFSKIIDVNVKGVYYVLHHILPAMVARKRGVVVNLSSGWGRSVSPEVAPYCATKWAIEGLTRALAEELPSGMAAVPLNPGIIDTDMLRSCFGDEASSYPDAASWAERAVPYILGLGPKDNGRALSVPQ